MYRAWGLAMIAGVGLWVACSPSDGNVPSPDAGTFDAADPSTGRWYGTIVVDTRFAINETTTPVAGTTKHQDHLETAHSRISISDAGVRSASTTVSFYDYQHSIIDQACIHIEGTNLISAGTSVSTTTPSAYLGLVADGNGGYTTVDIGGFVTAPVTMTSHNRMVQSGCAGSTVQTSDLPQVVPFQGVFPFDHIKGTLSADKKSATGATSFDMGGIHYDMRWSLARDKDIKAVVDDQTVPRVTEVTVDGSKSRGQIDEYTWTIDPDTECSNIHGAVSGNFSVGHEVTKTGETFAFRVLCQTRVHLHVKGPAGEDDDDATIIVAPRDWKTHEDGSTKQYSSDLDYGTAGSNRCALEKGAPSGHYIHTSDPANHTWKDSAYSIQQLDPNGDGPFAGEYYVDSPYVYVERIELVNSEYLGPYGAAYKATAAVDPDIANLLDLQISSHEHAHSTCALDWVDWLVGTSIDPARKIEYLAAHDGNALSGSVDDSLRGDNTDICAATQHDCVDAILAQMNPSPKWSQPAQICNAICNNVNPFYAAYFEDLLCAQ